MGEATNVAGRTDLFFVIGSSLTIHPAASLPEYAGGQVVVVNQGPVEAVLPERLWVNEAADGFFARVASAVGLSVAGE
jgi:NAD-dependent deacetylase